LVERKKERMNERKERKTIQKAKERKLQSIVAHQLGAKINYIFQQVLDTKTNLLNILGFLLAYAFL
jgi:hypothetical protein